MILGAIILLTVSTALETPLPLYFIPPSLNSTASLSPLEAPAGTLSINTPLSVIHSTSMVIFFN